MKGNFEIEQVLSTVIFVNEDYLKMIMVN